MTMSVYRTHGRIIGLVETDVHITGWLRVKPALDVDRIHP